jgi:hypothetical protein
MTMVTMQKWEYMWMYSASEKGAQVFIANGERLQVQTFTEALNTLGNAGWELVSVIPPGLKLPVPLQGSLQFCLKRPISD